MRSVLINSALALGTVMLADLVAGIVHWFEDSYCTEDTPVIGPLLIRPNIVHHHLPRFFTRLTWWQSAWDLVFIGVAVIGIAWWAGVLSWPVWLFVAVSVNANEVHKWAHRTRAENGRVISFFQDIGLLLTPRQHAVHHSDPKNTYYCPVTNLLNPLLELIQFWTRVEWLIERLTGATHRYDTSNRGQGPAPTWIAAYRSPDVRTNFPALPAKPASPRPVPVRAPAPTPQTTSYENYARTEALTPTT